MSEEQGRTGRGRLFVVGLGPGDLQHLTPAARRAIEVSDVVVGYRTYLRLIAPLLSRKRVVAAGMREEVSRAREAVALARAGHTVSVVCSGDAGVYGMAGLIHEVMLDEGIGRKYVAVEVVPGVSAVNAAAALLGAPLMHDFAVISLSDLMTPWERIAQRLESAARADFVIVLYNPKSNQRTEQIAEARNIVARFRQGATPVGIVTSAFRDGQAVIVTDLNHILDFEIGMQTTVIIGNSATFVSDGAMITPRGYRLDDGLRESGRA